MKLKISLILFLAVKMEKDPKKQTSDSYVIIFYKEVLNLLNNYSIYKNVIKEVRIRYGDEPDVLKSVTENEKASIIQVVAMLSGSIERTYIQYESLCCALNVEIDDNIKSLYLELSDSFMMDMEKTRLYITEINKFLVNYVLSTVGSNILSEVTNLYGSS